MTAVDQGPGPIVRAGTGLRRVASLATVVMLGLSGPLWVGGGGFPRVPFFPALAALPLATARGVFVTLLASVGLAALASRWRPWYGLGLVSGSFLILQDQHRFQPWYYQYAMTGLFLAALPRGEGLRYARWWFVAMYAHSGLSKLDVSFCDGLGLVFLRTALVPVGFDPARWAGPWRVAAVLAMPAGELAVASALAIPSTRRVGRAGAVALHAALIGLLGPFGMAHSTIVLVWNAAMLAEVWVAFGPDLAGEPAPTARPGRGWLALPVKMLFWAGVVLPLGERWGVFDVWPSHALYASHVERVTVWVHESELESYPPEVRANVREVGEAEAPWRLLDLTGWSRSVRGTPVYPQNRACLGLAESLAAGAGGRLVRVAASGPADRLTGRRRRVEATGLAAIRRLGRGFLLNARPARH